MDQIFVYLLKKFDFEFLAMLMMLKKIKNKIKSFYFKILQKYIPNKYAVVVIKESNLFDLTYYTSQLSEKKLTLEQAIHHYLTKGLNFNPNPYFDNNYYLNTYPDVKDANYNPLLHYIIYGFKEGRNPSKDFNTNYYINAYDEVKKSQLNPLYHFLKFGRNQGLLTTDDLTNTEKINDLHNVSAVNSSNSLGILVDIIDKSGLFDTKFYLSQLDENEKANNLIKHYIKIGVQKGLNPNAFFDTNYYLIQNNDVEEQEINPLFHYILFGYKEGRNPCPEFDTNYYLEVNKDVQNSGLNPLYHYLHYGINEQRAININSTQNTYLNWVKSYDTITKNDIELIKKMSSDFKLKPLISVVMPVYNPEIKFLRKAIESVLNQVYDNWELCIADDASNKSEVKNILEDYKQKDSRIKVTYRTTNGHISEASNSAIELVTGEYIALLDNDDELPKHALFMVAHAINLNPEICLIYSDEDKIDINGNRHGAYFKSNWNYDLFCGHNMISHLGVYKTSIVKKIGGFRKGFEGSQDYDLAHRFIEQINLSQIKHIQHILYHWRSIEGSTAVSMDSKDYAYHAALKSLEEHLLRTKQNAKVITAPVFGYRVKRFIDKENPLVSIIIPTKDKVEFLKKCIESIYIKTTYKNFEIIIVDNDSKSKSTLKYLKHVIKTHPNIKILKYDGEFNYSAINNAAVKIANGDIIGLLNNDIEVISEDWLNEIVSQIQRENVGAVGAKLYFPDETIQHAGIILGIYTVGNHIHKFFKKGCPGYFNKAQLSQNFSALTGACLFVKKTLYQEVGGLDEVNLKVAYNDIDFCLKLIEKGYINVWTPYAELYHHESASREKDLRIESNTRFESEIEYMYKKWGHIINDDPYYNPNLSNSSVDYQLAFPPRIQYPWKDNVIQ